MKADWVNYYKDYPEPIDKNMWPGIAVAMEELEFILPIYLQPWWWKLLYYFKRFIWFWISLLWNLIVSKT